MKRISECEKGDKMCEISSVDKQEVQMRYCEIVHITKDRIYLEDICIGPSFPINNNYFCVIDSKLYMPVKNLIDVLGIYKIGVEHGMVDAKKQMRLLLDIKN